MCVVVGWSGYGRGGRGEDVGAVSWLVVIRLFEDSLMNFGWLLFESFFVGRLAEPRLFVLFPRFLFCAGRRDE